MSWRKYGAVRYGLVFATLSLASNQTLTTETATIALSAPTATLSTGPGTSHHVPFQRPVFQRGLRWFGPVGYSVTPGGGEAQELTVSSQTIALSAPQAVSVPGGVSLAAGANVVALSAPTATISVAGTPHHVPFMRPVFQRGLRWFGPVGYSATPGLNQSLTFGAQTLAISAPDAVRAAGGVTLSAGAQTVALSAPPATLAAGGSALSAGAQTLALSAPAATLSGGEAPSIGVLFQRPVFQRGIRAYGPPSLSTTPDVNRTLSVDAQTIALSAPAATLTSPGVSTVVETLRFRFVKGRHVKRFAGYTQATVFIIEPAAEAQTLTASAQVLAISAPTATRSAGAVSLSAGAQVLALSAPTATLTAGGGTQTLTASAQTLALSAPAATLTAGTSTLTASAQTLALSAPSVSVVQEGVLVFGAQTIALSAPTATATGGAVTRTTAANVLALSVGAATIGQSLNTTSNTIAFSAPSATLTVGAATVQASAQTLAISAPPVSVAGATTLPDIVVAALESRQPERTLAMRNGVRVLDTRNGERTVEFNG